MKNCAVGQVSATTNACTNLRAVGVLASVGHGELTGLGVLELEVLICGSVSAMHHFIDRPDRPPSMARLPPGTATPLTRKLLAVDGLATGAITLQMVSISRYDAEISIAAGTDVRG